jgi:hypothetical protein
VIVPRKLQTTTHNLMVTPKPLSQLLSNGLKLLRLSEGISFTLFFIFICLYFFTDHLYDLVVRVPGYRLDSEAQVRFPALPDFLRSSGSGTGSTQPREYN